MLAQRFEMIGRGIAFVAPEAILRIDRIPLFHAGVTVCLRQDRSGSDRNAAAIAFDQGFLLDQDIELQCIDFGSYYLDWLSMSGSWRDYWLGMDARGTRAPTIAAVAATYEAEMTFVARGLGISFTTQASARLYNRPGVVYVRIVDRPTSYTALAWNPAALSSQGELVVRHLREQWDARDVGEPAAPPARHP